MTSCRIETCTIPTAHMGKLNPVADIHNISYIHSTIEVNGELPGDSGKYIGQGMLWSMLPYCQQDDYDRNLEDKDYQAIILENDHLKAMFLPQLGGRLWSLWDKDAGRELLYRNPVVQPCNLALRNAWCSGGVEFNMSIKGHNPLTCDDVFAQEITVGGCPGVRFFEYERIRGMMYCIDAWLPEGSRYLYLRPRMENRTGRENWQYWFSNIAVPVDEKTRVIVPAESTFENYYDGAHYVLEHTSMPQVHGVDVSYPERVATARDYFFYIRDNDPKWITSLDETGYGLVQCSTREMKGRKLFLWGQTAGGNNWNDYLCSYQAGKYIEIQAGLSRTQQEHIPMADGAQWVWVEAYGAMQQEPAKVHGTWDDARANVQQAMDAAFPGGLDANLEPLKQLPTVTGKLLHYGSGWGALETLRRQADGEPSLSQEVTFPADSLTDMQEQWLQLLNTGCLPTREVTCTPDSYLVDAGWYRRLAASQPADWYGLMHLGVMAYAAQDVNAAKECFEASIAAKPSCWGLRNLAMVYRNHLNDPQQAADLMEAAIGMRSDNRSLWMDMATTLLKAGRNERLAELYGQMPADIQAEGRMKLYTAQALVELEEYDKATELLNYDVVMPDIKEGENSISDLWLRLYGAIIRRQTGITDKAQLDALVEEQYPLNKLDFRMH